MSLPNPEYQEHKQMEGTMLVESEFEDKLQKSFQAGHQIVVRIWFVLTRSIWQVNQNLKITEASRMVSIGSFIWDSSKDIAGQLLTSGSPLNTRASILFDTLIHRSLLTLHWICDMIQGRHWS
jgi:hypothetical protein